RAAASLGQIGASIGLALKNRRDSIRRVGYDRDASAAKAAQNLGVIDEVKNLKDAVRDANVVVLALPLSEIRETLERIGPQLRENAVVFDTAPVKSVVLEWVKEFIPEGRFYLGLVPALSPQSFASTESGLKVASPDLFKQTIMVVDVPSGTPREVEELAFDLAYMLGAKPMLTDPVESDGLMASVHVLPQLAAAALLNATLNQAGWTEARKLAGRPYAGVTGGLAYFDDPVSLRTAALGNRIGVVHALDILLASLKGLRDDIENNNEENVAERLKQAFDGREHWLDDRSAAEWMNEGGEKIDVPDFGERINQIFFGGTIADRLKKKK
ncbi:MAG: prephenate dehydrogenase/arogenate dehydrogenase family protein, partial [Chloroflexi bacterium]|nr:prephenate dehydrogenase/arogenate dehydrogenase family protein [Chloroflexota bacterium]